MRESNRNLVLNLIREKEPISQVEIAGDTHLSNATVTNIIKELNKQNFIEKVGEGKSNGGRRPTLLCFNPDVHYVIGVEFFADEMNVAVLNLAASIKKRIKVPTEPEKGYEAVFKKFARVAEGLLKELEIDKKNVMGVGVSFEGVVEHNKGELILSSRFGWRNVPIKEHIEKEFGIDTFVGADGETMLLGEHWHGVGKGAGDVVLIDVDAGVGSVAISGGRMYRGVNGMAGEIGHTLAVLNGPECKCGKRGCLETVASGSAILSKFRQGLEEGRESTISHNIMNSPSTRVAVKAVFDAAREGDEFALNVVNRSGYYLGMATAAVINYADPELIILTGCVIQESQGMILKIIRDITREQVVDAESRKIRIEEGSLGENAALIGAAILVYRDIFRLPLVHTA